jgi:hypothetical protein
MDEDSDATVLMADDFILKTLSPNRGTNMNSWMVVVGVRDQTQAWRL